MVESIEFPRLKLSFKTVIDTNKSPEAHIFGLRGIGIITSLTSVYSHVDYITSIHFAFESIHLNDNPFFLNKCVAHIHVSPQHQAMMISVSMR